MSFYVQIRYFCEETSQPCLLYRVEDVTASDVELSIRVLFPQLFDYSSFRVGHTANDVYEDGLLSYDWRLLGLRVQAVISTNVLSLLQLVLHCILKQCFDIWSVLGVHIRYLLEVLDDFLFDYV